MNKITLFFCLISLTSIGQSFHPAPGMAGSNAIKKDSTCFIGWATGGSVQRGYLDISDTTVTFNGSNRASFGNVSLACGPATGSITDILSLGDSGIAIMTFDLQIIDGLGYDFAIFENGFTDNYMEFAFVEVSSDGENYFRFPATSEIPLTAQIGNASYSDCRMVNNLAGKYRIGYGTPFDLSDLPDDPLLDKQAVRFVKLIDVIGAISGNHTSTDQFGHAVNDPYPTPFDSGGFDLEAIGIINGTLGLTHFEEYPVSLFPNPSNFETTLEFPGSAEIEIYSMEGNIVKKTSHFNISIINSTDLRSGIYLLKIIQGTYSKSVKLFID